MPSRGRRRTKSKSGKTKGADTQKTHGPDKLGNIAQSKVKRVVLVGTTGAGKSSTANLLAGQEYHDEGPFTVSNAAYACTHEINICTHETPRGDLEIVDTPGLGDRPDPIQGESEEEYWDRSKNRSTTYFTDISRELHQKGGLVLYVHKFDRGANYNHVKALDLVLNGAFVACAGLIITGGFSERSIRDYNKIQGSGMEDNQKRLEAVQKYEVELETLRREVENKARVSFAFVHGVDGRATLGHPAHTGSLLPRIQNHGRNGVEPQVAIEWQKLLDEGITDVNAARAAEANVRSADDTIADKERENVWLDAQIGICDTTMCTAGCFAACELWLWVVGLPGLGAGVALSMTASSQWARTAYVAKKAQNEEHIAKLRASKIGWEKSKSADELLQEAEVIKSLVYCH